MAIRASKLREQDEQDLTRQVNEIGEQMFRLRLQMSMGQGAGLKKMRSIRKDKARLLTVLREKELAKGAK